MWAWCSSRCDAARRTDACEARSSGSTSTVAPGTSSVIEAIAVSALDRSRAAITTWVPFRASSLATSRPRPPFPPVTTAMRPPRSGMSAAVQATLDATPVPSTARP
jgi:hypothetical protein